ncbi:calmodulin-related protein 97A [Eurytemora carolleeae]|uniref:calmodulin-related protein 97A n=1 Tax=Eurytemora carolleeae TaxID=1294199 RepID=UPI000C7652A1|nr:calmodulin-related protein 97A [Eurytemora carolleeae]|eukprot:XP_023332088.1 calmodulin-related protein 97A-like [Eurytemora affinis]
MANKKISPGQEMSFIKQVFGDFCSSNGRIPASRAAAALQVLGYNPLQSQVTEWTKKYRKNGMEFPDFLALSKVAEDKEIHSTDEEVTESLAVLDIDGEGLIPVGQLRFLMCQTQPGGEGEAMKPEEFSKFIDGFPQQDGFIRYRDLAILMSEKSIKFN